MSRAALRRRRQARIRILVFGAMAVLGAASLVAGVGQARGTSSGHINLLTINGSINPATADYLIRAIERSGDDGAAAVLIEMDTPGGLVVSTKDILKAMLNARVPVIVYVAPSGAWAASAGTYITYAAHIAAMAPGTSIGAAHPVNPVGSNPAPPLPPEPGEEGEKPAAEGQRDYGLEKAENMLASYMETIAKKRNRNSDWVIDAVRKSVVIGEQEAVELNVIDLVAENRTQLLAALDGREVEIEGEMRVLHLSDATIVPIDMTVLQALFSFLAEPDKAFILFLAGLLGLYIEVNNLGLILPGAIGVICLALAMVAFQVLPFSWVGLMLMLIGIGFFIAEVFVTSFGALFATGTVCFLVGGTMLFDRPAESDLTVSFWSVLVPSVIGVALFGGVVALSVGRSMLQPQTAGESELVGLVGRADSALGPEGRVFVRGEFWNAIGEGDIEAGESVEVVAVEGLTVRVRRAGRGSA